MAKKTSYQAIRHHGDGREEPLKYEEKVIRGEKFLVQVASLEREAKLASLPKAMVDSLGVEMALLVNEAKVGQPLVPEAPICDNIHGCQKMRVRFVSDEFPVLDEGNGFTQLTFYVCQTKNCVFSGIEKAYQIRERYNKADHKK